MQGTLSPKVEEVIKWLKEAYGGKVKRDIAPQNGATTKQMITTFERDFGDEIGVAIGGGDKKCFKTQHHPAKGRGVKKSLMVNCH
jgi:hypothetical protein